MGDLFLYDLPKLLVGVPLAEHKCGTCMMVLQHICAVRCFLNNTWIGRGGITAWSPHPSGFLPVGTPKPLVHAPVDNEETSWMPVRLSASIPISLNECGSHVY
jgi:hypothetical protein